MEAVQTQHNTTNAGNGGHISSQFAPALKGHFMRVARCTRGKCAFMYTSHYSHHYYYHYNTQSTSAFRNTLCLHKLLSAMAQLENLLPTSQSPRAIVLTKAVRTLHFLCYTLGRKVSSPVHQFKIYKVEAKVISDSGSAAAPKCRLEIQKGQNSPCVHRDARNRT